MFNVGEISANVTADQSKFNSAMKDVHKRGLKVSQQLGDAFTSMGKKLTMGLTVPIGLAGGAMIKMASDAEETEAKFGTVFSNISRDAQKSAKVLTDSFGLSQKAAQQLLGDTGDLLAGFGFSQKAALDLADGVNQLAVDLASFTNFSGGAEGASQALTKALLGERESVKSLGISILEADVQAKVLKNTQKGLTFETERQAKAYATLQLAQEQSKNAIGDFARTQDSFANQMRQLQAEVSDLAVSFGKELLPIAKSAVGVVRGLIEDFSGLSQESKQLGLKIAGIAALAGPTLLALGALSSAIGALSLPVLGFIAVVGGIGYAFKNARDQTGSSTGAMQLMLDKMLNHTISVVQDMMKTMDWAGLGIFDGAIAGLEKLKRNVEEEAKFTPLADAANFIKKTFDDLRTLYNGFDFSFNTEVDTNSIGRASVDAISLANNMNAVNNELLNTRVNTENMTGPMKKIRQVFMEAYNSMSQRLQVANMLANQFTQSFGQGMANVIVQGEKLEDVLKNIGKLLLSSAIQTGLSLLLSGGLTGTGFFGSGGGLFGKLFGGGRAKGGPVSGGMSYVVGEQGPEIFTPSRSGSIIPNSGSVSGGITTSQLESAFSKALGKHIRGVSDRKIFEMAEQGRFG